MNRTRFRYTALLLLLILAAFAVRALSLVAQPLWRDEVDALRFATVPWSEMFVSFTRPGWNGPLYYFLLRGWVALAGRSEYALRFFSLALGVLCVPLIYALGRRLFDRPVGLLATLLWAFSPYSVWYGQEVKMYTLLPALALLAIYALRRAIEGGGRRWWVAQIVATSMACYSHILAAMLIPVQVLLYFAWLAQARNRWRGALFSLACLTLPYLPLARWQVPLSFQVRQTGFPAYTLGEMIETLLNGWSLGMTGWGWWWGTVLMGGLAGAALFPGAGKKHRLALLGWLSIPLLGVWLISLRQPLFTDRYLIWAAPAFYLLAAVGLAAVGRRSVWAVAPLLLAILVLDGVNLWRQATVPIKSDFRAAAAYVAGYQQELVPPQPGIEKRYEFECYLPLVLNGSAGFGDLIVFQIPYARYTFDYYFPAAAYPWAEGLYTNHRAPDGSFLTGEREVAHRMQEMTAGYDVVWLVATEVESWDERGLVQAWLDGNMRRTDEAHFARVDVYRYSR